MRRRTGRRTALALLMAACAACSPAAPATAPTARTTEVPPAADTAGVPLSPMVTTPEPTAGPSRPMHRVPLALVVHATRTTADVDVAAARRVIASGASRWSVIGQAGGAMRVVSEDGRTPAEVLSAVRSSRSVLGVLRADAVDPTVRVLTVGGRHPLRDPKSYPIGRLGPRGARGDHTDAVGDIMLARRVGARIRQRPGAPARPMAHGWRRPRSPSATSSRRCPATGPPTQGGDSFGADPEVLEGLELAGFDLVSLANNHVGDYGRPGAAADVRAASPTRGFRIVGAGRGPRRARRPVVIERDGVRIGFIATESIGETPAATADRPGTNRLNMPPRTGPLDRAQLRRISGDIAALSEQVDTVVVLPALGHPVHPPARTEPAAGGARLRRRRRRPGDRRPSALGAGLGEFGSAVVVHSLGNFVFDMDFQTKTREGIFVEIVLWGGKVKAVEPVPYVIGDAFAPRRVSGGRAGADPLRRLADQPRSVPL